MVAAAAEDNAAVGQSDKYKVKNKELPSTGICQLPVSEMKEILRRRL